MHQYNNQYNNTAYGNDHQGLLDDLGSLVGRLLSEGQGQLDPTQHRELQNYQQELNQYRQNPQYVQSNPGLMDGMLGRIIQLAGPLIAGYATHRLLQQLQEQGQGGYNPNQSGPFGGGSSGPFTQGASGPFDRSAGGPFDRSAGGHPAQHQPWTECRRRLVETRREKPYEH
jgi:hypothetical protein